MTGTTEFRIRQLGIHKRNWRDDLRWVIEAKYVPTKGWCRWGPPFRTREEAVRAFEVGFGRPFEEAAR